MAYAKYKSYHTGYTTCKVEVKGRTTSRSCPSLPLLGQHLENIEVASGSVIDIYSKIAMGIEDSTTNFRWTDGNEALAFGTFGTVPALEALLGGIADTTGVVLTQPTADVTTTFVPTVSAFDAGGWAYEHSTGANHSALMTPFDELVMDDGTDPNIEGYHTLISRNVSDSVFGVLQGRGALNGLQNRTAVSASGSTGDFWHSTGLFQKLSYIQPSGPRDLPIFNPAPLNPVTRSSRARLAAALVASF